jgi:hypothetical protein
MYSVVASERGEQPRNMNLTASFFITFCRITSRSVFIAMENYIVDLARRKYVFCVALKVEVHSKASSSFG